MPAHVIQSRPCQRQQGLGIGAARRLHGGEDAASLSQQLAIAHAGAPQVKFFRAISREDKMGVRIDQAGRYHSSLCIHDRDAIDVGRRVGLK